MSGTPAKPPASQRRLTQCKSDWIEHSASIFSMATFGGRPSCLGALVLLVAALFVPVSGFGAEVEAEAASLEVWHTFGANSVDERIFLDAVAAFEAAHPDIAVEPVRIPYLQNLQQFINSSQGGEAPDLVRLSDTELGRIGHISVEGLPLLEDLRPHLTPVQRSRFEPRALNAMRYGNSLYAIPVSQGTLALIYNKALFDAAGVDYPRDDWTTDDLIAAAKALTGDDTLGFSVPLKWSYWFIPFLSGFGATLFDSEDNPTLDSPGSAQALEWFLDLERVHGVAASSTGIENMSTQFQLSRAAMVLDGSWNWNAYLAAGLDLGVAVMPIMSETGLRMGPMFSVFGWSVSKQSANKVEAVKLAQWLSSYNVQKEFALETYLIPSLRALADDPEIAADTTLNVYLRQAGLGAEVPTTRVTFMVFEQLDTALELTSTGQMDARSALQAADEEMERILRR
ncbi:MAG: extracellular solute-binding protein [Gammaproteobacteria bacterium]|nr:extracellular solute-binding protein [Gammaproteobacteria bacterium]MYK05010.1 extracellular solute-binding protein [Gammaproteobacteria bacterium]